MKTKHTTTPWVYHSGMVWKDGPDVFPQGDRDGVPIARMDRETDETVPTERDANAEFIVRAVNVHEELVEACRLLIAWDESHDNASLISTATSKARAAIAKAEGK